MLLIDFSTLFTPLILAMIYRSFVEIQTLFSIKSSVHI